MWTADTTYWPLNSSGVWIYVAMDVKSRWTPYVEPYLWRSGASSVEFFMNAFGGGKPEKLVTDKGSEFISGHLQALLKVAGVDWQGLPQNTPEARGLIERLNLTLKREWLLWKEPKTFVSVTGPVAKIITLSSDKGSTPAFVLFSKRWVASPLPPKSLRYPIINGFFFK